MKMVAMRSIKKAGTRKDKEMGRQENRFERN